MANAHPYPARRTRVIFTEGSDWEIGVSHAEQVGDESQKGMASFYYSFWKRIVTGGTDKPDLGLKLFQLGVERLLVNKLRSKIPHFLKERLMGVSKVTGQTFHELSTSVILPDLMPMLQAYFVKAFPRGVNDVSPPLLMGCSSFVSNGELFLQGRNLDFPGVAYWDRYPVIQVTRPKHGLSYVAITTAGVPIGGITGINEAQIGVSLHQHYCRATDRAGIPPFAVSERILMEATSLSKAMQIIQESRIASSWAFVLTDGKRREAQVIERHPNAIGVNKMGKAGTLAHSNFFQTDACRRGEYATTARMNWDNYWRRKRIEDRLTAIGPGLTPTEAVQLISDHYDPYWEREKILNRTVSQVYNIQSLVLDPHRMKLYLAEGDCPIQIREFVEYDLGALLSGKPNEGGERLPAYAFSDPKLKAAKESYILSFVKAMDNDLPGALEYLYQSLSHSFYPEVAYVIALVEMKQGNWVRAKECLEEAKLWIEGRKEHRKFPPEYFEICIYLARACEVLNESVEAQGLYEFVAEHPDLEDLNLKRIAKRGGPYKSKNIARVFPYSSYVPFL